MTEVGPFVPQQWEAWLEEHHETATEVWLVSWKKATGRQGLSYGEAVEIATMFGWVDSKEKGIDAERYMTRWTPRRAGGNWTEKNRALAERLRAEGRLRAAGLRALEGAGRGAARRVRCLAPAVSVSGRMVA